MRSLRLRLFESLKSSLHFSDFKCFLILIFSLRLKISEKLGFMYVILPIFIRYFRSSCYYDLSLKRSTPSDSYSSTESQ
jgi:hypothetical protein